jgi:hypothetical protein
MVEVVVVDIVLVVVDDVVIVWVQIFFFGCIDLILAK